MDGQEFIISAIAAQMETGGALETVKYLSRTTLAPIPEKGDTALSAGDAVIAQIEKMKDDNKDASNVPMAENQKLTLFYITKALNVNAMNEADWETAITAGKARFRLIKLVLLAAAPGKVKLVNFGETDISFVTIGAVPTVAFTTPVEVKSSPVETLVTPGVPALTSPIDEYTPASLLQSFDWEAAADAKYYRFQLSADEAFTACLIDQSYLQNSSFTIPLDITLEGGTIYYWRVRGERFGSSGAWSGIRSFTTEE